MACLLGAVTALLVVYAAWQLRCRRWQRGVVAASAALTPVALVPVLLTASWVRYEAGDRSGGRARWLAAITVAAMTTLAAGLVVAAGRSAAATWLAVLAVQTAVAVGVFYWALHAQLGRAKLVGLIALRWVALAGLLVLLFKPAWSIAPADQGKQPSLTVLVDRSESMSTVEAALPSRYAQAMQMLADQQPRLAGAFQPHWRHFATRVESVSSLLSLASLTPAGAGAEATDIAAALRSAGADSPACVLLISDGIDNAAGDVLAAADEIGRPVYVAAVGSLSESASLRPNVEVLSVDAPMTAAAGAEVTISAEVNITGLANKAASARLIATDSGEVIATAPLWADADSVTTQIQFTWTAADLLPAAGPAEPAAAAEPGEDAAGQQVRQLAIDIQPLPGEAHDGDNHHDLHVLVTHPRIRALYVEGTVRPEYKWLRRQLAGDSNVQLISLVRIDESRFWAQGNIAGQALTRLPRSDEEFAMFDVIILGDLDSSFLSADQMARLEQFVADGGGLAMLGGHNSFGPGGYGGTPVERAMPVVMGTRGQGQATAALAMQLTAAGERHAIFAQITRWFSGPEPQMAGSYGKRPALLSGCVAVARAKDGAATLAVHPDVRNAAGPLVVLAVQSYGSGRSLAFTADTTWRWRLAGATADTEDLYGLFWGQVVRWLAGQEPGARREVPAVVMGLDRQYVSAGQEVKVVARVIGPDEDVLALAQARCDVLAGGDDDGPLVVTSIPLTPDGEGGFVGQYAPGDPGDYTLRITVTTGDNKELGADSLPLTVAPAPAEMQTLARNERLLQQIAQRTGGQYADIAGLPDLVDEILAAIQPADGTVKPYLARLYNFPAIFLIFVAAVTAEWILRRRWQLR